MSDDRSEINRSWADRHYAAIGKVATKWAALEAEIDIRTVLLAGFDADTGACLTAQIAGPARKLDAYIALARLRGASDDTMKKLGKFLEQTFSIGEKRNRIVHDQWYVFPSGPAIRFEITARKKLIMRHEKHTTEDINQTIAAIAALIDRLDAIDKLVWADVQASRETL
jgi:hypothetical protein